MPPRNRIEVPCDNCGKILERTPKLAAKKKHHFCDQACTVAFNTGQVRPRPSNPTDVICEHCGKPYQTIPSRLKRTRYCSTACQTTANGLNNRKSVEIPCARCGKSMSRQPWDMKHAQMLYCSRACSHAAMRDATLVDVSCSHCGKALRRSPSQVKRAKNQFCDPVCHDAYRLGKLHPELLTGGTVECAHCGAPLYRQAKRIENTKNHFCNSTCYSEWQIGKYAGPDHYAWKGGYSRIYGRSWRRARREARKRDNYCCQYCGASEKDLGKELDVHHIKPFRLYGIDRHTEANEQSNLVSLCRNCHANVECGKFTLKPNCNS